MHVMVTWRIQWVSVRMRCEDAMSEVRVRCEDAMS